MQKHKLKFNTFYPNMKKLQNLCLIYIFIINFFVNSANNPETPRGNPYLAHLKFKPKDLEVIVVYISNFVQVLNTLDEISKILVFRAATQFFDKDISERILITNKEVLEYLDLNQITVNENSPRIEKIIYGGVYEEFMRKIKSFDQTSAAFQVLIDVLNDINKIIEQTILDLQVIKLYFSRFKDYYETATNFLQNLQNSIVATVLYLKAELKLKLKVEDKHKKEMEESRIKADIKAHQLMGCCEDGKCGSLDTKKSFKKKKKKKKRDKKKEDNDEYEDNSDQDFKSSLETSNSKSDNSNNEQSFLENNSESFLLKEFKKERFLSLEKKDDKSSVLLKNSLNVVSKLLELLVSIDQNEQKFLELVKKIIFFYKLLLIEKKKDYSHLHKSKILELLEKKELKLYLQNFENVKATQNVQMNKKILKECFSMHKGIEKNTKPNTCSHCICKNCRTSRKKVSLFSID